MTGREPDPKMNSMEGVTPMMDGFGGSPPPEELLGTMRPEDQMTYESAEMGAKALGTDGKNAGLMLGDGGHA